MKSMMFVIYFMLIFLFIVEDDCNFNRNLFKKIVNVPLLRRMMGKRIGNTGK